MVRRSGRVLLNEVFTSGPAVETVVILRQFCAHDSVSGRFFDAALAVVTEQVGQCRGVTRNRDRQEL